MTTTIGERQPSLHEIAQSAGVSVSTVSRYLKGQLALRPETELRVRTAMDELGYAGSPRAQKPRTTRSGVIGLVVPQIGSMYFGRIVDRIIAAAEAQGFAVVTGSTSGHARKERDYVALFVEEGVDGIIYAGNHRKSDALASVIAAGIPLVVIDEAIKGLPDVDTVLVDDYAGAYLAVGHLTALGHERIALVTGPAELASVRGRTRGYLDALDRAGIDAAAQVTLQGAFSEEFGIGALSRLLSAEHPPTAVFAASDTIALGILAGAASLGVRIPEDLSVVGFDDVPAAGYVTPRLTTVRTPADRMATTAVSRLLDRIDDPSRAAATTVVPVSLVLGDSAAPHAG